MCYPNQQRVYDAYFFLFKLRQDYTQILELRLTFFSHFKNMTFNHYLTKSKSMLQWKMISMLDKNREIVCSLDYEKHSKHPLFEGSRDNYFSEIS